MAKSGGSLPRGRRLRHEVPDVPSSDGLAERDRQAQDALRRLVERSGGRFADTPSIVVDEIDEACALFDRWARRHAVDDRGRLYFPGRPGLWHALDELYPLQRPDRWDPLRLEALRRLESAGWVRRSPPRGAGFYLPD